MIWPTAMKAASSPPGALAMSVTRPRSPCSSSTRAIGRALVVNGARMSTLASDQIFIACRYPARRARRRGGGVDDADLVRHQLERLEGAIQLIALEHIAQPERACRERVAPAMLAEDDPVGGKPDIFRFHDLVRLSVLQHAVLMDPGFVGESIRPDDGLVARRRRVGDLRERPARNHDLGGVDVGGDAVRVGRVFSAITTILERAIASPFTNAVDGAFYLPRPPRTAASELATAMPRSSWQWVEKMTLSGWVDRLRPRKRNRS